MTKSFSSDHRPMSLLRWAIVLAPLLAVLGSAAGLLSGSGSGNPWYEALTKPGFNPPGWMFGVVWPILYALQGIALAMVIDARGVGRRHAIMLFIAQFILNLLWSPLFFGAHEITMAFWLLVAMLVLAIATTWYFWRLRRWAGMLMLPYLAWLCFAAVLNFSFDRLNPDAETLHDRVAPTQIGNGAA